MSLTGICRVCLRTDRTVSSLVESIVPKFDSPPNFVIDLWNIFAKMLISYEDERFPNEICNECLDEIQRMYYFIIKCERSEDILMKIKTAKICLKKLKAVGQLHEPDSLENIPPENYLYSNISQIKIENVEFTESFIGYDEENGTGQTDSISQQSLIVKRKNDSFSVELLEHLTDIRDEKVLAKQDLKHKSALDVGMESDEFEEIDSEEKSGFEVFKCSACRYQSRMIPNLKEHMIKNHVDGQMCKLCSKEFNCTALEHCSTHIHRKEWSYKSTKKKAKCKLCLKIFGSKSTLNRHLIIHTEKRPFKCEYCLKTFRQKYNLTRHLKCHTGERPFKCEICPQTFGRKSHLAGHIRCHTGERPYKCEICPKRFGQKCTLMRHLKNHSTRYDRKKRFELEQIEKEIYSVSIHEIFDSIIDQTTKDTTIVQYRDNTIRNERTNHLDFLDDATADEIPAEQDIKREPEEFNEIESKEKYI